MKKSFVYLICVLLMAAMLCGCGVSSTDSGMVSSAPGRRQPPAAPPGADAPPWGRPGLRPGWLRPEDFFRTSVRLGSGLAFLSIPSNPDTVICRLEGVVGLKGVIDIIPLHSFRYKTKPSKSSMV